MLISKTITHLKVNQREKKKKVCEIFGGDACQEERNYVRCFLFIDPFIYDHKRIIYVVIPISSSKRLSWTKSQYFIKYIIIIHIYFARWT